MRLRSSRKSDSPTRSGAERGGFLLKIQEPAKQATEGQVSVASFAGSDFTAIVPHAPLRYAWGYGLPAATQPSRLQNCTVGKRAHWLKLLDWRNAPVLTMPPNMIGFRH
jgi:hypothetical protein